MKRWHAGLAGPLLLLALGGLAAAWVQQRLAQAQQAQIEQRFESAAEGVLMALQERMRTYEYGLRGARGAVIATGPELMDRRRFNAYMASRDLVREFPGSRGFGLIRRVPVAAQEAFLDAARADGWPDFQIRQINPQGQDRQVIQYLEPVEGNEAAIGLDIMSEPHRRDAAQMAIDTGAAILSQPITLSQATRKPSQGMLFLLPIYGPGLPLDTVTERRRAVYGLVYSPLAMDEILQNLGAVPKGMLLRVSDAAQAPDLPPLFVSARFAQAPEGLASMDRILSVYGRPWRVEARAAADFMPPDGTLSPGGAAILVMTTFSLLALLLYVGHLALQRRRQGQAGMARLAAIVESSSDAIVGKDLDGRVTSWNPAAERIFGYSAEQALGMQMADLLIPDDLRDEEQRILATVRSGGTVRHFDTVRRRRDGRLIDVAVTVSPIRDANGLVIGAAKTARDITDEKRHNARFKMAVDAAGIGIWIWQLSDNQLFWDERMCELYGLAPQQHSEGLFYEYWRKHVHPEDLPVAERKLQQLIHGQGVYDPVFRVLMDNGQTRWIKAAAIIERDRQGQPVQMVGTNLDISAEVEAKLRVQELNADLESLVLKRTAQLQDAVVAAEQANLAKSAFLSNMSHEIRTPLNAILGLAYLLQQQRLDGETGEMVGKIHSAGRGLLGIVNDILDFSKIEAERLDLEHAPFRLSDVLDNLASIMAPMVGARPVELLIGHAPTGADYLIGDALRLGQVLTNLLGNALKFTHSGEVVLDIRRLDVDTGTDAPRVLRFSVRDTGIGIPLDKQASIFDAFNQADNSTTRSYGGTGLGLAISSRLVALMGGKLAVQSSPGQGSEFSFELSLKPALVEDLPRRTSSGLSVLIADDHDLARQVLRQTAQGLGWRAQAVESGEAVLACLDQQQQQQQETYDVLVLDWRMPGLDGLETARRIRARQHDDGRWPIIVMVTAHDRSELREQDPGELVDAVLTKPVTASSLYDAVLAAQGHRGQIEHTEDGDPGLARLQGVRVLVVDDSDINREVAARMLQREGADVSQAEDGRAALQLMDGPQDFDLVLMDMQMPVLDGYSATRSLRQKARHVRLPVLAISAGAFKEQRERALAAGVNGFVAKPYTADELVDAIRQALQQPPLPPPAHGAAQGAPAGPQLLNRERGLQSFGEEAVWRSALLRFSRAYRHAEASLASTHEAWEAHAHKLRGAAALLGLEQLAAAAAHLEQACTDTSAPLPQPAMKGLQQALQQAFQLIEESPDLAPPPADTRSARPSDGQATARLRAALESDDYDHFAQALSQCEGQLGPELLAALDRCLASYDFRGARLIFDAASRGPVLEREN
ncbi:CHASE domain-containing protein [Roseateles sp. DB2]|uniref:CHASE domain-containing protein n=1 Tax=Roseateles sp. DB2 TaxID=3453717 RepID=UPI003EF08732